MTRTHSPTREEPEDRPIPGAGAILVPVFAAALLLCGGVVTLFWKAVLR